jgi:hypothetical protein
MSTIRSPWLVVQEVRVVLDPNTARTAVMVAMAATRSL